MDANASEAAVARLRQHRIEADIPFRHLAPLVGISESGLCAILRDDNPVRPNARTLHKIQKYLDALPEPSGASR